MSSAIRVVVFIVVVVTAVAGAAAYAIQQHQDVQRQRSTSPAVAQVDAAALDGEPRIVFRHTGLDSSHGLVAMVPLADPAGARAFTDVACDRVAAWDEGASCLVTERGVVTKHQALQLDAEWQETGRRPLPGVPSRTRVSSLGDLVATTSFVTGHSYMSSGFSTRTDVRSLRGGADWGNLEEFSLTIDDRRVDPVDRNVWGVTFIDAQAFFATVATGGKTWLVKGDLAERTLASITSEAECPAVSPDRSKVAFKVDVEAGRAVVWQLAVLDLATGERTLLKGSPRGVDDQVEWLDDDTVLFGLPRADEPGVTDVWSLDITTGAEPEVLIPQAWSPTVVR